MTVEKKLPTSEELANFCAKIADDRKGESITLIKIGQVTLIADYFIICSGTSMPHLRALTENIKRKVREEYDIRPLAIDGESDNSWIILDFGNVIIHVFTPEARERYDLENLWADAEKIEKFIAEKTTIRKN